MNTDRRGPYRATLGLILLPWLLGFLIWWALS